jgi:hypothetical protein
MTRSVKHDTYRSTWRSLGAVALVNLGVLVALPQAGHSDESEGTVRILHGTVPAGFLVEGRYADDPIIRLVTFEPLVTTSPAHDVPSF